jgi:HSP20 family molecular chaperone IbpA
MAKATAHRESLKKDQSRLATVRQSISLEGKLMALQQGLSGGAIPVGGEAAQVVEALKVAKTVLEKHLREAVTLLAEETKAKKLLEVQLKELQKELESVKDPERIQKLEETVKRQRTLNDNLQQQFMLQMEKIGELEKQLKQYRTEKLEYETKYEERIFFIERQSREKREKMKRELQSEINELKKIRVKLERSYDIIAEQLKDANAKLRMYGAAVSGPAPLNLTSVPRAKPAVSTGPAPPPRAKSVMGLPPTNPPTSPPAKEKKSRDDSVIPRPQVPQGERLPISPLLPVGFKVPGSSVVSPVLAPFIANQYVPEAAKPSAAPPTNNILYDIWEGGNRLVVSIDVPGVEMELIDIYITRFTVTIARKVGVFETKHLQAKYTPVHLLRFRNDQLNQIVTNEITLPFAVQPERKIAYHHHGTVYLTIEKMETTTSNLRLNDWSQSVVF